MATLKDQIVRWSLSSKRDTDHQDSAHEANPSSHLVEVPAASVSTDAKKAHTYGIDYYHIKVKLHQMLISRIDLNAIESLSPVQLRNELERILVLLIEEESIPFNHKERVRLIADLKYEILGLGPLEPLLADPNISEIMVNGYEKIYIEKNGRIELTDIQFGNNEHLMKIIDKIVSRIGRRIDEFTPMVDARLPDGSRVNAIIPPLALDGPVLTIRRFAVVPLQLYDILEKKTLTSAMGELLAALVKVKTNIIISGGTGTGKTTLLNILSSFIPSGERIVTIEDTAELQLQQNHVIRLETRPPNVEGKGEITMHVLVKNALRMRPDRIVLGEVRGVEVIDMLQAMNTGHEGSLTTIHANTPKDALIRLENLMGMGNMNFSSKALRQIIASSIHFIIQVNRMSDGSRKIASIQEVIGMQGDSITMQEIYTYKQTGMSQDGAIQGGFSATGIRPERAEKIHSYGISLDEEMFTPAHNH